MCEELKFEAGKWYVTRIKQNALVVAVRPGYMIVEVEGGALECYQYRPDGSALFRAETDSSWDLVAEWKPPQRWRVGVYRCEDNRCPAKRAPSIETVAFMPTDGEDAGMKGWQLVASVDVTEGQSAEDPKLQVIAEVNG